MTDKKTSLDFMNQLSKDSKKIEAHEISPNKTKSTSGLKEKKSLSIVSGKLRNLTGLSEHYTSKYGRINIYQNFQNELDLLVDQINIERRKNNEKPINKSTLHQLMLSEGMKAFKKAYDIA